MNVEVNTVRAVVLTLTDEEASQLKILANPVVTQVTLDSDEATVNVEEFQVNLYNLLHDRGIMATY